jgi:hypothetical protein
MKLHSYLFVGALYTGYLNLVLANVIARQQTDASPLPTLAATISTTTTATSQDGSQSSQTPTLVSESLGIPTANATRTTVGLVPSDGAVASAPVLGNKSNTTGIYGTWFMHGCEIRTDL